MPERLYDVVIFGATGFAGRLVARYLAHRRPRTVGPYAHHGAPLVAAAVAQGTNTCDLTGEPQFVRRMIDAHHAEAEARGVRIVHCCGFDSVPSDLGVWVLQQAARERLGAPCLRIEMVVEAIRGGFSGGTLTSLGNVLTEAKDPQTRRILGDPYALAPGAPRGPDRGLQVGVRYSEAAGAWTAPFMMAGINERVVRRSHALLGLPWGEGFSYHESMRAGPGLRGRIRAGTLAVGLGLISVAMGTPPVRRVLQATVLPAQGQGPSEASIEAGFFKIHLYGWLEPGSGERIEVVVRGRRDPGYGATACMLAESALCLATDPLPERAGVLTPATAMGGALVARLDATDVQFEVLDAPTQG